MENESNLFWRKKRGRRRANKKNSGVVPQKRRPTLHFPSAHHERERGGGIREEGRGKLGGKRRVGREREKGIKREEKIRISGQTDREREGDWELKTSALSFESF